MTMFYYELKPDWDSNCNCYFNYDLLVEKNQQIPSHVICIWQMVFVFIYLTVKAIRSNLLSNDKTCNILSQCNLERIPLSSPMSCRCSKDFVFLVTGYNANWIYWVRNWNSSMHTGKAIMGQNNPSAKFEISSYFEI